MSYLNDIAFRTFEPIAASMTADKTNLDHYYELLQVIEDEFGIKWLTKRATKTYRKAGHWVPAVWAEAKTELEKAKASKTVILTPETVRLFDLAADLKTARTLDNYSRAITPATLKGPEFEKNAYVAHIAAIATYSGYSVQFVPVSKTQGEQTPDLRMEHKDQIFYVECKRKDVYTQVLQEASIWEQLKDQLSQLHNDR